MQKQKKSNNILTAAVKGALRGAAKSGGTISTPFRAVQTGIDATRNVRGGFKTFHESQKKTSAKKLPAKPTPAKSCAKPKAKK